MLQRTCAVESCGRVTHIDRECFTCCEWHCREHDIAEHHKCGTIPYEETKDSLLTFKAQLVLDAREKILQDFPGYTVEIPAATELVGGSINTHLPVVDTDGVKWLARIRCRDLGEFADMTAQSAAATMQFLEPANAIVPRVRLPPTFKDYYLVEYAQGKAGGYTIMEDIAALDDQQRKVLFRDLASHFIAISTRPIKGIGSLRRDPVTGAFTAGPILEMYRPLAEQPYFLGPFQTTFERYDAKIDDILRSLQQETDITSDVIAMYLAHLEMRRLIGSCEELHRVENEHFVMHGEPVGSQFMVHGERLAAVLDWDWATTTSKAEAFAGSFWFWDMDKFGKGSNELSTAEHLLVQAYKHLGREDMAECVTKGKKYQRLSGLGLRPDILNIKGLQDAFGAEVDPQETLEEWCLMAEARFKGHEGLARIISRKVKAGL